MKSGVKNGMGWVSVTIALVCGSLGSLCAGDSIGASTYLDQAAPADVPVVFRSGAVSGDGIEIALAVHPDGSEVYLTRIVSGRATLLVSAKAADGWTVPEPAPFSSSYDDAGAFVMADGETLFFTTKRPGAETVAPRDVYHIWTVTRRDGAWQEPTEVAFPLESASGEASPSLTLDGTLYYAADYPSLGGYGLYRSRLVDGVREMPERVDVFPSADGAVYVEPFVSPDESLVLFYSAGRPDNLAPKDMLGDLYVSFRNAEDEWTEPQSLGAPINTIAEESSPVLTPDGRFLFFASSRAARNHLPDVYWVSADFLRALNPAQP